jgi:hypothetical protein
VFETKQSTIEVLLILTIGLLAVTSFPILIQDSGVYQSQAISTNNNVLGSTTPVYIWFFGYVGNSFYPTTDLGITQQQMLSAAKNLSETFGKQNLVLVSSVDETPISGGTINSSMIASMASYITQLHKYAAEVFGRLDFYQFNLTSLPGTAFGDCEPWYNCPIYNQSKLYVDELGLNGIWFDHPSQYQNDIGNVTFNQMMQNLTDLFPGVKFIINQTPSVKLGYVKELSGYSWENMTYASPSPVEGSLTLNENQIAELNDLYPGHVILHLDAEGPPSIGSQANEPMSIFASLNASQEISNLTTLIHEGSAPSSANESYAMVVPVVGSWTCDNATSEMNNGVPCPGSVDYDGTLYNGLSTGNFSRSTIGSFEQVLLSNLNFPRTTISASEGQVGSLVVLNGSNFPPSTSAAVSYMTEVVNKTKSNASGDFTVSFRVPVSTFGNHTIATTDGNYSVKSSFVVLPSIILDPSSGKRKQAITVEGTGFLSDSPVVVRFNGSKVITNPSDPYTNSSGSFSLTFTVKVSVVVGDTYVVEVSSHKYYATENFTVS